MVYVTFNFLVTSSHRTSVRFFFFSLINLVAQCCAVMSSVLRTAPAFLANVSRLHACTSTSTLLARLVASRSADKSMWKRGLATAFDRTLPHVNIGTIGHVDHGKTTLTAVWLFSVFRILINRQLQSTFRKVDKHSLWSILKLTRRPRKRLVESRLQQLMLNIRPINATMRTLIVLVMPITSRT